MAAWMLLVIFIVIIWLFLWLLLGGPVEDRNEDDWD